MIHLPQRTVRNVVPFNMLLPLPLRLHLIGSDLSSGLRFVPKLAGFLGEWDILI